MDGWIDAWMQGCMDAWMQGDACSDQGNEDHQKSAATKTTKATFCCFEFWGAAGTEQWFPRFRGRKNLKPYPKTQATRHAKMQGTRC